MCRPRILKCVALSTGTRSGTPNPVIVVPVIGVVPVTVGGAQVVGIVVPRAAPHTTRSPESP